MHQKQQKFLEASESFYARSQLICRELRTQTSRQPIRAKIRLSLLLSLYLCLPKEYRATGSVLVNSLSPAMWNPKRHCTGFYCYKKLNKTKSSLSLVDLHRIPGNHCSTLPNSTDYSRRDLPFTMLRQRKSPCC